MVQHPPLMETAAPAARWIAGPSPAMTEIGIAAHTVSIDGIRIPSVSCPGLSRASIAAAQRMDAGAGRE
jgi:hypothetical protein